MGAGLPEQFCLSLRYPAYLSWLVFLAVATVLNTLNANCEGYQERRRFALTATNFRALNAIPGLALHLELACDRGVGDLMLGKDKIPFC